MVKIEKNDEGGYTVHMDQHFKLIVDFIAFELKVDKDYLLACLLQAVVDKNTTVLKVERENNGVERQGKGMGRG